MTNLIVTVPQIGAATRTEFRTVARVMAVALAAGPIGRLLGPNSDACIAAASAFFEDLLDAANPTGCIRVARVSGRVVGAAVWIDSDDRFTSAAGLSRAAGDVSEQFRTLVDRVVTAEPTGAHPSRALAFIGVDRRVRRRGIASALLAERRMGMPFSGQGFWVLADASSWTLFRRQGYTAVGPPSTAPDAVAVQLMWLPPGAPARPLRGLICGRI